ncbi:rhodanese-like domain-containing protein [Thalassobacillus hwangdonensis]|uniref:Rhodanese-like domain-containing protein n=1 Tax=Thalassobacillus hwangdonensis TaxID=546108 RepID=A0ABW3KWK6_9BACI
MKTMTAKEIENKVANGEQLNLIDVRGTDEVSEGHIPGAVNIPLHLLEFRMNELDKSKEYVMVCRSGGRSGQASQFLDQQGYEVINMEGGMMAWEGPVK